LSKIRVGDRAPDFTLPDQRDQPVRLQDLLGAKNVVLYFYPKDASPACTTEARAFRDACASFAAADTEVVGISSDSVRSHRRFAAREGLPFLLLSDRGGLVRELYGVKRTLGIMPGRVTYVIDRGGIVRHVYTSQFAPARHALEARRAVEGLSPPGPSPR
jgi:peroxiredoxin Q/BCP